MNELKKFEEQLETIKKSTNTTLGQLQNSLSTMDLTAVTKARENYISNISSALSAISTVSKKYENSYGQIAKSIEPLIQMSNRIAEITAPLQSMQNQLNHLLSPIAKISAQFSALRKLGDNQFIWFTQFTENLIDEIGNSENVNSLLDEVIKDNDYFETNEIIKTIRKSSVMKEKRELFSQSVSSYRRGHYLLACVGFVSIIDLLLTKISGVKTTKFLEKVEIAIAKANTDEVINEYDIKYFYMSFGLETTLKTVFAFSKFEEDEPHTLNRHWIAHGNTKKHYEKLDCIKLINLIYALLLIANIEGGELDE